AVCEDRGSIRLAAAAAVFEQTDALVLNAPFANALAQTLLHEREPIVNGPAGQVVVEPVHMVTDIGHAVMQTERLGNVEAVLLIDAEANWIGQHRLSGEQTDFQPLGGANPLDGERGVVGSSSNLWIERRVIALRLIR